MRAFDLLQCGARSALVAWIVVGISACGDSSGSDGARRVDPALPSSNGSTVDRAPRVPARKCDDGELRRFEIAYDGEAWINSFAGGKLDPRLTTIAADKLRVPLRLKVAKGRDKLHLAENEVATARDTVEAACEQFLAAHDEFRRALSTATQQANAADADFARTSDGVTSIIECWSYSTDAAREVSSLQSRIQTLAMRRNEQPGLERAVEKLERTFRAFDESRRAMQLARDAYAGASKTMATIMAETATASRMRPPMRTLLSSSIEALPKIETIRQQLDLVTEGLAIESDEVVSRANAVCRTASALASAGLVNAQDRKAFVELKEAWDGRKASVQMVIDKALTVEGAEW